MQFVSILKKKRDMLMDKYIAFLKKSNLTEQEITMKQAMQQELINLDFQIEEAQYESSMN